MAQNIAQLRTKLSASRAVLLTARKQHAAALSKLATVHVTKAGAAKPAQAAVDKARATVQEAAATVARHSAALDKAIAEAVARQQLGHIAPADVPVALLPVGMETRFDGNTLLVRVIPDEIHVEDHDPALGDAEVEAGRDFWRALWRAGTGHQEAEREAWATLVGAVGNSRRAAWIVDQTAPPADKRPKKATPADKPLPDPDFPDPPRRDAAWSQAPVAHTLPDRFIAIAYRREGSGGTATWHEIGRALGRPVSHALQLGPGPDDTFVQADGGTTASPDKAPGGSNDGSKPTDAAGLALPDGMRWVSDVNAAEQAGLLLRMPLPPRTDRIDRLIVLGVSHTLDPDAAGKHLQDLLAGHHFSSGLELLPIGTPSNNSATARSGFTDTSDPQATFDVERNTATPVKDADGGRLARALGIPADTFRGVAHSNENSQTLAGQFNTLIWPSAMGYWLESLAQPGPTDKIIADLRAHFISSLRARGPLPPLRVGKQPYGVLPVTSIRNWQADKEPLGVVRLVGFLQRLFSWWLDGVGEAPVVRAGAKPEQGLLDALGQLPVSRSVRVRSMVGAEVCYIPIGLGLGHSPLTKGLGEEATRQRWMSFIGLKALGIDVLLYLGKLVAKTDPAPLLRLPYTVDTRLKAKQRQTEWKAIQDYLEKLSSRSTGDLQKEDPTKLTSVLTMLARRSVILERVRVGLKDTGKKVAGELVEAQLRVDAKPVVEAEMISTTASVNVGHTRSVVGRLLAGSVKLPNGSERPMTDHLDRLLLDRNMLKKQADYLATVVAAEAAAGVKDPDTAALLLGEALDSMSHRYDAWVTSVATRRLNDLRSTKRATGITLGAYGAVEDLRRKPAPAAVRHPPANTPENLVEDPAGGGYIHAPSLPQAASAAVLRAGHLAHAANSAAGAALAIDLSSARVRTALGLLDGVREGQSLGALLGYRIERQLHELGAHTAVAVVRGLAPPPVVTGEGTPEGENPRAVCDGLALSRMKRSTVLAAVAAGHRAAVGKALDALDDAVDAVADLLLAEGVHQIVRGNPDRAATALDTLNRGEGAVSDPDVVRTPRAGTGVTQRVVIAIDHQPPPAPVWPTGGIRAKAEPRLAAWAGHLLGDPTGLTVTVQPAGGGNALHFPLTDLGLGALDVVYETVAPRALRHARKQGAGDGATLDLTSPKLAAMLAMARLLRDLLTRARAGNGYDLARPQDRGTPTDGPPSTNPTASPPPLSAAQSSEQNQRLEAARKQLGDALAELPDLAPADAAPAEAGLAATLDKLAAFGLHPGSDPARAPDTKALIALHRSASSRLQESQAASDDPAALFGKGFPVLPLVAAPFPAAVNQSLDNDPVAAAAADTLAPLGGKALALASWLEQTGRVRPQVGRLADVVLGARLRGTGAPCALRALQIPAEPFPDTPHPGQWVGLGFPGPLDPEPVTSWVLHALGDINASRDMALLVVDDYTELVPSADTTTGVAFGFDAPGARPPQSILLAVPPKVGVAWSVDSLADVIGETLDLAKIRMVDLSSVAWAGRFAPTIYLTDGDVPNGIDLPMKEIAQLAHERYVKVTR